jgi:hypothetical protein
MTKDTCAERRNLKKDSMIRIIEAVVIAAIVGLITMYGTSQAITAKIDYIRTDLSELRQMFMTHVKEK